MRRPSTRRLTGPDDPMRMHSSTGVLGATAALAAGFLVAVAAVLYPLAVALAVGTAIAVRPALRGLAALRRARRRTDRSREVCVPGTGVCVEA